MQESEWAMILLTPHFTADELTRSYIARRNNIDNTPPRDVLESLRVLAEGLERVRDVLRCPVFVLSGYRCPALNKATKGAKNSAHMTGLAADFEAPMFGGPEQIFAHLKRHKAALNFDQLILEFPPDGWLHVGFSHGSIPRGEMLTYDGKGYQFA